VSRVAVVETGIANVASVCAGLARCGLEPRLTRDPAEVARAPLAVLPGVGAFGAGMASLRAAGLVGPLVDRVESGRPLLAVCLGMQLLCEGSEESPGEAGLGVAEGRATRFPGGVRVPQMGWNLVRPEPGCALLTEGYAYFANSYRLTEAPAGWLSARAEHGGAFVGAMERGAVLACQFHPELSGPWGLGLISRWAARALEASPC
jgi:imidazole glycerol-phosphate synthase subunit HisH